MEISRKFIDRYLSKPINAAHCLARRAEECERNGDIAKAICLHQSAGEKLLQILSAEKCVDAQAKLSLTLQREFHDNRVKFLLALDAYKVIYISCYYLTHKIVYVKMLLFLPM